MLGNVIDIQLPLIPILKTSIFFNKSVIKWKSEGMFKQSQYSFALKLKNILVNILICNLHESWSNIISTNTRFAKAGVLLLTPGIRFQ